MKQAIIGATLALAMGFILSPVLGHCGANEGHWREGVMSHYSTETCQYNPDPACPTASGVSLYTLIRTQTPYAASYEWPLGTWVWVCRDIGQPPKCVEAVILDRGPARRLGRLIDVSPEIFKVLYPLGQGLGNVRVREITETSGVRG